MKSDTSAGSTPPDCFSVLDKVFPQTSNGLRSTPASCLQCIHKTVCLQKAMFGQQGLKVKEEIVDRSYAAGQINFLERWLRKKSFYYKKSE